MERSLRLACLALLVGSVWGTPARAQEADIWFEHLTVGDGLPQNFVVSMAKDSLGFVWVGTAGGLARYTGYGFDVFQPNPDDTTSIRGYIIRALHVASDGTLWVGTQSEGLSRYLPESHTFEHYPYGRSDAQHLSHPFVLSITEAADGAIWIGTEDGLNRLDPATGTFRHFVDGPRFSVNALWRSDDESSVWAWANNRLYHADGSTGGLTPHVVEGLSGALNVLKADEHGTLWLGGAQGLWRYDPATRTATDYTYLPEANTPVLDLIIEPVALDPRYGRRLWFSTRTGLHGLIREEGRIGFSRFSAQGGSINQPRQPISRMLFDEQSAFWIGTQGWGIAKADFKTSRFPRYRQRGDDPTSLSSSSTRALWADSATIWVGTNRAGLNRIDRETGVATRLPLPTDGPPGSAATVKGLSPGQAGTFWAVWPWKVEQREATTGRVLRTLFVPEDHPLVDIGFVHEKADGRLWVGGGTHLLTFAPGDADFTPVWDEPIYARDLVETQDGNLWVATDAGLVQYAPATGARTAYRYNRQETTSLSNDAVQTLWAASDSVLWVGTANGLNRFSRATGQFERFTTYNSTIPDNYINGILGDVHGHLWISTNRGLTRYDPKVNTFITFDYERGLQGVEFNRGAYGMSAGGLLLFGGEQGVNAFDPDALRENHFPPKVYLMQLSQAGEVVYEGPNAAPPAAPLRFEHRQNDLSFAYLGLHYSEPERNTYQYFLEGGDDDWQPLTTAREARYTNLAPGDYTFHLRAANAYGVWSADTALLSFTIRPPWWGTWAFRLAALLVVAAMGIALYRRRVRSFEEHRDELQREVALRTADLQAEQDKTKAQAQELERLNQQQRDLFANVSHETRTPLTLILSPVEDMLEHRSEELSPSVRTTFKMIRRNGRRLLHLVNQILDLARLEAGHASFQPRRMDLKHFLASLTDSFQELAQQKGIDLLYDTPIEEPVVGQFDPALLEHIFFNLIANGLKYTPPGGKVIVSQHMKGKGARRIAVVRVGDTGIGIPKEQIPHIFDRFALAHTGQASSTGIGLALVKESADLHGGSVAAMSGEGFGAMFTVRLPLGIAEDEAASLPLYTHDAAAVDAEQPEPLAPVQAAEEDDQTTILVVEDNEEIRQYIAGLLADAYRVLQAEDGVEGLEMAAAHLPDLVISDVMMPRMDGVAMCAALKGDPALAFIPTILLTAKADVEDRLAGLEAAADDYIAKPFNVRELRLRVRNLIEARRAWQAQFGATPLRDAFPEATSADDTLRQQIEAAIHEQFTDAGFSASELAEAVGISTGHLRRRMQELFGASPVQVIRGYRLEQAALQLRKKTGTVSEIAYAVGFNSVSYFTRAFREAYGVSPSAYPRAQGRRTRDRSAAS
ncbi:MAG: two-component regulator propeller domain-containing protein [Bacteroidota bacterium]